MPVLLPMALFYGVHFICSLFFPSSSAALHAGGALGLLVLFGAVFRKHPAASAMRTAAGVALLALVVAVGVLSLVIFTMYSSLDRMHGMWPDGVQWTLCLTAMLLPPLLAQWFLVPWSIGRAYRTMYAYALAIGATVALVELVPGLQWAVAVASIGGLYAVRHYLHDLFHVERG